jgi:hypothetical protein
MNIRQFPSVVLLKCRGFLLLAIVVIVIVYFVRSSSITFSGPSSTSQHIATATVSSFISPCQGLPGCTYSATETCYLDGCIPVICPGGLCGGGIVTTTIATYMYSTQSSQTLVGIVKIIPGTGSGVYFFDAGSVQYHLVFCNCNRSSICNCPNIPALSDSERMQVTGAIVTPSTYGSILAPGGDIYVQTWSVA